MELALEEVQASEFCNNFTGYDSGGVNQQNSTAGSINSSCYDVPNAPYQINLPGLEYGVLVFYLGTFLFGLCGNTLVIYIITAFRNIRIKSVANYYIRNLAFADLLFVLGLPLFCWATYTHEWPITGYLGEASCKIAYICRDISKFASVFTLIALSIDRCLASYHNLGVFRTIQVGKGVCIFIWISCVIISTPYLMYARTTQSPSRHNRTSCLLAWPSGNDSRISYMTFWTCFQLLVGLAIPSIVIFTSHAILCRRIKRIACRNGKSAIKKPCRRMTHTVMAVVVTFVLCQIPYHVIQVLNLDRAKTAHAYKLRGETYIPPAKDAIIYIYLNAIAQVLIFISSCCNPIIYGLLNENFRKLYHIVLCTSRCRRRGQSEEPPVEPNFDMDGPYSPIRFRFEISFHLPCIGIQKLKHGRLDQEDRNRIEMQTDITHGVLTAETNVPLEQSEQASAQPLFHLPGPDTNEI